MNSICTPKEALVKLEHFCAYQERCHAESISKMKTLGLNTNEIDEIMVHLIDNNFRPARLGSDKAGLDAFLDFLRAFHIACNAAIKQLNDPSIAPKGNPWKIWLNRLAEIVAEVKSSSGEGDDESKVDHPFVQFIRELQNCLPAEYQRDQAALAEALLEARSKPRNKNKS